MKARSAGGLAVKAVRIDMLDIKYEFDGIARQQRVGLMALATDWNIEDDLRRLLPTTVKMYTTRIGSTNPITVETLLASAQDITRTARTLLPDEGVDILIYGCTSGAIMLGEDKIARLVAGGTNRTRCINPALSSTVALRALGASKLSILTPYVREINEHLAVHFTTCGFNVLNIAGFELHRDFEMTSIPPDAIVRAAKSMCDPEADALFISCTSMRSAVVINQLEQALSKPVVTSNQALAWHIRQLLGIKTPPFALGRLASRNLSTTLEE
jgi:maleate isomerase